MNRDLANAFALAAVSTAIVAAIIVASAAIVASTH